MGRGAKDIRNIWISTKNHNKPTLLIADQNPSKEFSIGQTNAEAIASCLNVLPITSHP